MLRIVLVALQVGLLVGVSPAAGVVVILALLGLLVVRSGFMAGHWDIAFLHLLLASVFVESVAVAGLSIGRILAVACVGVIFIRVAVQGYTLSVDVMLRCLPALAFALTYAASGLWAPLLRDWIFSMSQVGLALLFFAAVLVLTPKRDPASVVRPLLVTYIVGAAAAGLIGLVQQLGADRAAGLQGDPNIYAMYQVAAVPAALVLGARSRHRWVWGLSIVVSLASVLASGSRGGIITVAATLLVAALVMAPRRLRSRLLATGVVAAGALAMLSFATNQRAGNVADDRASGRIDIWHVAWVTFKQNPATGIGSGQFRPESIDLLVTTPGVELLKSHLLLGGGIEVHNLYLESLVERGLPGLCVLVVLLVLGGVWLLRSRTPRHPAVAALVPMLVAFSVASVFLSIPNNKLLWILLGLSVVLEADNRANSRDMGIRHETSNSGGQQMTPSDSTGVSGRPL